MYCKLFAIISVFSLTACGEMQPTEIVLSEGIIKVIDTKHVLIQETTSVANLTLDKSTGNYLSKRYKPGEKVKFIGNKTLDKEGNNKENIKSIEFEDGNRLQMN